MNKQPQSFYEGTASNKLTVPQPHLLLEFQEKRREYLDKNVKQRRDDALSRNRQLLIEAKSGFTRQAENNFEEDKDTEDITEQDTMMNEKIADVEDHLNRKFERMEFERPDPEDNTEIAPRKKKSNKLSDRTRLAFLPKQLTIPEWMIAPPSNLNGDYWFVYSKPEGPRCFVISTESQTFRRNKNGIIEETFLSKLPGGSPSEEECTGKTCILDCIFNKQLNVYYIMDVIVWNDVSMSVNSTESRFFFIQSNILTNKELAEVSEDNEYIFATPSKHNCTVEGFTTVYQENTQYVKEGLLFAHKEAEYIAGSNPYLLAWKDMFTSLYPIETDSRGLPTDDVQCVLELNENNELQTLDSIVLAAISEDDVPGNRFKGGNLYRVSIESMGVNQAEPDIFKAFTFYGVKILNKSSFKRAKADNISKIIFQYLIRNVPITAEHIRTAIQRSEAQESDVKSLE